MRLTLIILLLVFSEDLFSREYDIDGISYEIPKGFDSLEKVDLVGFDKIKNMLAKEEIRLIAQLFFAGPNAKEFEASVTIWEEEIVTASDMKYLQTVSEKFESHSSRSYSSYDWVGFRRIDLIEHKLSYFVRTERGRQIVVISNYPSKELLKVIEGSIKKISLKD